MNIYDLFESVDIIVDAKLKDLKLDRTLLCQIDAVPSYAGGRYGVVYENSRFYASAADTTLQVGDLVYVGVPKNNYNDAFIISKKIQEADIAHQINPCQNFYTMVEYIQSEDRLVLNKNSRYCVMEWELSGREFLEINDMNKYDYMGIEAVFNSSCIKTYPGNYGLKIYLKTREIEGATQYYDALHENRYISSDMLMTNAFVYPGDNIQCSLYNIQDIDNIVGATVVFFCDDTIFDATENEELILKNFKLRFGFNLNKSDKPSLAIYTPGDDEYYAAPTEDDPNKHTKAMYAKWIYVEDSETKAITYSNAIPQFAETGATITWEKFVNGTWDKLENASENPFICTDTLNFYKTEEQYRCKISYSTYDSNVPLEYISNVMHFTNLEGTSYTDIIKNLAIKSDTIEFTDLYNSSGKIVDRTKALSGGAITATAEINYATIATMFANNSDYTIRITWSLPLGDTTMLTYPESIMQKVVDNTVSFIIHANNYSLDNMPWTIADKILTLHLPFQLQEYYAANKKNNTIALEVSIRHGTEIIQSDTISIDLIFNKSGVCETDYVINFSMYNGDNAQVSAIKPGENVKILADLYDCNGNKVETINGFEWTWYYSPQTYANERLSILNPNADFLLLHQMVGSNSCSIVAKTVLAEPLYNYYNYFDVFYILQASYKIKNVETDEVVKEIVGYLPIAINNSYDTVFKVDNISGPTQITYSSLGSTPSFYQVPYAAYNAKNESILFDWVVNIEGIETDLIDVPGADFAYLKQNAQYYPKIIKGQNSGYMLSANKLYIDNAIKHFGVIGYDVYNTPYDSTNEYHISSWIQPIMIYQTNSFSSFVNDWDGRFAATSEQDTMLSARLGAGKKESNGSFSGVLLGDWQEKIEDGSWGDINTGICGYNHGKLSYGFRDNGTAFLGQKQEGRIEFNGERGIISSATFDGEVTADGTIKNTGTKGSYWDLKTGTLVTNDGHFRGDITATSLVLDGPKLKDLDTDGDIVYYDQVKTNNYHSTVISKEGLLEAENAVIKGEVHADKGLIGTWNITNNGLYTWSNGKEYTGMATYNCIDQDFEYEVITTSRGPEITITGLVYIVSGGILKIPETINGTRVTAIAGNAFQKQRNITSVIMSNYIEHIGDYAFHKCANLQTIQLSKNLKTIGAHAFHDCYRLKELIIPDTVTSIGYEICNNCYLLQNVYLSNALTRIPAGAFSDCVSLPSITIPKNVQTVRGRAFKGCKKMAEIYILSNSITEQSLKSPQEDDGQAENEESKDFTDAPVTDTNIKQYITDVRDSKLAIVDGCWLIYKDSDNLHYDIIAYVGGKRDIVYTPTQLNDYTYTFYPFACYNNAPFKTLIVNGKCTAFNESCFSPIAEEDASMDFDSSLMCLERVEYLCDITNSYTIGKRVCYGLRTLQQFDFEEGLTSIADQAFGYTALLYAMFPRTLKSIGQEAFDQCEKLLYITIPASVTSIGQYCFGSTETSITQKQIYCEKDPAFYSGSDWLNSSGKWLTHRYSYILVTGSNEDVAITDKYTSTIKTMSFNLFGASIQNTALEFKDDGIYANNCIFSPNSTTPFVYGCCNFTPSSNISGEVIDESKLQCKVKYNSSTENTTSSLNTVVLYIPTTWTINKKTYTVYGSAQNGFKNTCATLIRVPNNIKVLGKASFENGVWIKHLQLSKNLQELPERMLAAAERCETLFCPDGVLNIMTECVSDCRALATVKLGTGLQSLQSKVFYNCDSLVELVLPRNLVTIGQRVFEKCRALRKLIVTSTKLKNVADTIFINDCKNIDIYCDTLVSYNVFDRVAWQLTETIMGSLPNSHVYQSMSYNKNISVNSDKQEIQSPAFYAGSIHEIPQETNDAKFLVLEVGSVFADNLAANKIVARDTNLIFAAPNIQFIQQNNLISVTGWTRPEEHMYLYYKNGICVGGLDFSSKCRPQYYEQRDPIPGINTSTALFYNQTSTTNATYAYYDEQWGLKGETTDENLMRHQPNQSLLYVQFKKNVYTSQSRCFYWYLDENGYSDFDIFSKNPSGDIFCNELERTYQARYQADKHVVGQIAIKSYKAAVGTPSEAAMIYVMARIEEALDFATGQMKRQWRPQKTIYMTGNGYSEPLSPLKEGFNPFDLACRFDFDGLYEWKIPDHWACYQSRGCSRDSVERSYAY